MGKILCESCECDLDPACAFCTRCWNQVGGEIIAKGKEIERLKAHETVILAAHDAQQRDNLKLHEKVGLLELQNGAFRKVLDYALDQLAKGVQVGLLHIDRINNLAGEIQHVLERPEDFIEKQDGPCPRCALTHGQHRPDCTQKRLGSSPTERPCCVEAYARGYSVGKRHGETGLECYCKMGPPREWCGNCVQAKEA